MEHEMIVNEEGERGEKERQPMKGEFWLTRVVLLRCLGFLFVVAFSVSLLQNEGLIGEKGLTPATLFMERFHAHFRAHGEAMGRESLFLSTLSSLRTLFFPATALSDDNSSSNFNSDHQPWDYRIVGFLHHPTLFWFVSPTTENIYLFSLAGVLLSLFVCVRGASNALIMFSLWMAYFSIVNVGQTWYSFGWESQLLETSLLAAFSLPLLSLSRYPRYTAPSLTVILGMRWLLFRIMLGAGMIKIRGDTCWRELTCMHVHYQTQPVPNPISMYFHYTHDFFHRFETLMNHFVELVAPFLLLVPHRTTQMVAGAVQIAFQAVLICSGNLSFLNWLTALPGIACFDDLFWSSFFSDEECQRARTAAQQYNDTVNALSAPKVAKHKKDDDFVDLSEEKSKSWMDLYFTYTLSWPSFVILFRRLLNVFMFVWIGYLSYPVIRNILSPNQGMNISFDPFRVVNSYGAFGSVTKVRHEVILQGTSDMILTPVTKWKDFEFHCKPGDINRRPCVISPYHFRLDWLMWFAAFQNYQQCPWIVHLAYKLLSGEVEPNYLLAPDGNPFYNTSTPSDQVKALAPKFVRAVLYEYQYPALTEEERQREAEEGWEVGRWWKRRAVREYFPAIEANNPSVRQFLLGNSIKK